MVWAICGGFSCGLDVLMVLLCFVIVRFGGCGSFGGFGCFRFGFGVLVWGPGRGVWVCLFVFGFWVGLEFGILAFLRFGF